LSAGTSRAFGSLFRLREFATGRAVRSTQSTTQFGWNELI